MGGQNLLQQGRSCTGQPNNEDGIWRVIASSLFKCLGGAGSDLFIALPAGAIRSVLDLSALDLIPFVVVKERFLKLILVFKGLSKSKLKINTILAREMGIGVEIEHGLNLLIVKLVGLEVGKGIPRITVEGLRGYGRLVGGYRLRCLAPGF